jgi:hypothetical protein
MMEELRAESEAKEDAISVLDLHKKAVFQF